MSSGDVEQDTPDGMEDIDSAYAHAYGAELFYEEKPTINIDGLHRKIRKYCGNVGVKDIEAKNETILFFHEDNCVQYEDGYTPAQFGIITTPKEHDAKSDCLSSLQQSWGWKDAAQVVERCDHTILATDLMASGLHYKKRVGLFRNSLRALIEAVPCKAIHFKITQQFVDPEKYIDAFDHPSADHLYGMVNARLFNVEGKNEIIMDTLGLAAIGLPDLQCHFQKLDVNKVAKLLYDYAYFIYEKGDIIEDGNAVPGISDDAEWKCQHEISLIHPRRLVIDINPGRQFGGGNRI